MVDKDKDSNLVKARQLKKFVASYMESELKEKNVQEMSLQDLNSAVNQTEFSEFLRNFFFIDSRQLIKRLHMFLLTYPDRFAVNAEKETVRLATPKDLSDLRYNVEDRTCEFLLLCLSLQSNFLISVKQLRDYLRYAAIDVERYIKKNYENLVTYLEIYPTLFYVTDDYVGLASTKKAMQKRGFDLDKHETLSLEERLISRLQYIDDVETGETVRDLILSSNVELIAFDSEGTHLGETDGILSLIQIAFIDPKAKLKDLEQATIVENLRVYFFDILKCEELVKTCIEPILVQPNIIKILHDARNDLAALSCYFKVNVISKVFDSSRNYFKLTGSSTNGLHTIYEEIAGLRGLNLKPRMRNFYIQNDAVWEERPLRPFLLYYAALDVLSLMSIYLLLDKKCDLSKYCPEQIYTDHTVKEPPPRMVLSPSCVNVEMRYDAGGWKSLVSERGCKSSIGSKPVKENALDKQTNKEKPDRLATRPTSKVAIDDLAKFKAKFEELERYARGETFESD